MTLNAADLRSVGGKCYGHLFENVQTGLPRDIFWSFTLEFAPVDVDGEELQPALTIEWLTRPLRQWRDLVGASWSGHFGSGTAECSVYLLEHICGEDFSLEVLDWRRAETNRRDPSAYVQLKVRASMTVDLAEGGDGAIQRIVGEAWLDFAGVVVNLDGRVDDPAVLDPFIDAACLKPPQAGRAWWPPRVGPS
ncbi:MAG: hypothetical protein KC912_14685 [Proteobacteria bacterium]|nr:hypothetical protein [Pseudomonadota bacterium]